MAKGIYFGVDDKARKVKKLYFGVDGKARKIKKMYIGVNGQARLCWSGGQIKKEDFTLQLAEKKMNLSASSVGNYALFAGGTAGDTVSYMPRTATVDAFNKSLTRYTPTNLSYARYGMAGGKNPNYALFAGGVGVDMYDLRSEVDAYNDSFVRATATAMSERRKYLASTSIGDYALVGGGRNGEAGSNGPQFGSAVVDAYNLSLVRSSASALIVGRHGLASTPIGNYALFGGGVYSTVEYNPEWGNYNVTRYADFVDPYDTSLVRTTLIKLSVGRSGLSAGTVGNKYALFAGGYGGAYLATVDAFDTSLVRTTPTALSSLSNGVAVTLGDNVIFQSGSFSDLTVTNAYDPSLVRTILPSIPRGNLGATSVGDYALFAGGRDIGKGNIYNTVDVFSV